MCLPQHSSKLNKTTTMDLNDDFTLNITRSSNQPTIVIKPSYTMWDSIKQTAKFRLFLLILACTVLVQSSNAIPVPASDHRLSLHTQQYREKRYQQLLQEQRSLVVPTPHRHHLHHRSVGKMPQTNSKREDGNASDNDVGDFCRTVHATEQLKLARKQANTTFHNFYHLLERYTQAQHDENLENFYEQWSKHSLKLEHPYAQYLDRNINVKPNPHNLPQHLKDQEITDETLATELLKINQTLQILESIYKKNNESREQNKDRIRFDMRGENESDEHFQERLKTIDEIYRNIQYYLQQDLYHARSILATLKIDPQNDFTVSYNKDAQQMEWLLFLEHLSIMKYFFETYTYLLEHCRTT